jgi:hypothetical protein
MNTSDCFREKKVKAHLLKFGWTYCVSEFLGNWDAICGNNFFKNTVSDSFSSWARKETMTGKCIDFIGTFFLKYLGSLTQCAGCINHIVNDDARLALDIADQFHLFNLVCFFAFLVEHCEADLALITMIIEMFVEGLSSAETSGIWGNDHNLGFVRDFIKEITQSCECSLQVIECSARGHVSLGLRNMQVH